MAQQGRYAGSAAQTSNVLTWANVGYATGGVDGCRATLYNPTEVGSSASYAAYLRVTNFGFDIPPNATVRAVFCVVRHWASWSEGFAPVYGGMAGAGEYPPADIQLEHNGSAIGNNLGQTSQLDSGEGNAVAGANWGNLWGASLTPAMVNSSTFGVRLRSYSNGDWYDYSWEYGVDVVDLRVTYERPPAGHRNIEHVGSATGTTSATLPTHQNDDVIVAFAFRDGSSSGFPTIPSGWTTIGEKSGTSCCAVLCCRVATGPGTTTGTWTNATSVVFGVYRNARIEADDQYIPSYGGVASNSGTSNTLNYPALAGAYPTATAMLDANGKSWVLAVAGHRSTNQNLESPPTGTVNRANVQDSTDEASLHDTNGGVSSWSSTNVTLTGTSSGWVSFVMELRAKPIFTGSNALFGAFP